MRHWLRSAGSGFSSTASICPCPLGTEPRCFLRHGSSIWRTVLAIPFRWSQGSRNRCDNSSACDTKAFGSSPSSASPSSILSLFLRAVNYETAVLGAVLGAFTLAYVEINNAHSEIWKTIPLKEFIIGSLFAAGTLLGVTPHIFAERSTMIFAAIFFASLCSLNCVSIAI
jgi:hypothetical protein